MSYPIEEGIPIPPADSRGGKRGERREPRTPWTQTLESLRPGQSTITNDYQDFRRACNYRERRPERLYAIRKVPGQGWRVWRQA